MPDPRPRSHACWVHEDCFDNVEVSVYILSKSRGIMDKTLDSPCNDPCSNSGFGGAAGIWVYCPCGSAMSSTRDVKQGCRLCSHKLKIMYGHYRN